MTLQIEKKNGKSPHLALTSIEHQNGSANKRNVSLLMKSDVEITPELSALIEKVAGVKVEPTDVEKASYNMLRKMLCEAVKKFNTYEYAWSYVEDFDEEYVVFGNDEGLFYTTYTTTDDGGVSLGNEAISVNQVVSFREDGGKLILADSGSDNSSVQSLIVKSFDSIQSNEKLVSIIKSIQEKGNKQMDEIQKAVDTATSELKTALEKASSNLAKAEEKIEALQKAAQEKMEKERKARVEELVSDVEKAAELLKATASLDDESFNVILKSFTEKKEVLEKSDLFTRVSDKEDIQKSDVDPLHVTILKQKFNQTK